ncbi:NAD-dependent epimerase/dehydratase family protein [Flavobacterium sp.]|uniref:NAD-dependent epimerase/dehydratase family protein n=1 Tax=Flavobacterium sp. TaxID=239 RepID=UPI00286E15C7|nr:NAD-dependent epimerase/dehydratase family protein [Flavobacterium sp.]
MKTILGTGQLGLAIMQLLLDKNPNEEIVLVNRTGKLHLPLPANVELTAADATSKTAMAAIAKRSDLIFNCTDVPYDQWAHFYPATASALAYALRETNTKLVFADNLYSYGNVMGKEMNEQMPHSAKTKKGKIRAGVINTLLYSGESYNNRVAFVKAADFIGPRIHKGIFGTDFLDRIHNGKRVMLFGNIDLPHTFTYINDFAAAMINVGTANDTFGQLWHVPNAPALSLDKWVHLFEVVTNKKIKSSVTPKFIIRIAGLFNSFIRELYEMAYQFEYPY